MTRRSQMDRRSRRHQRRGRLARLATSSAASTSREVPIPALRGAGQLPGRRCASSGATRSASPTPATCARRSRARSACPSSTTLAVTAWPSGQARPEGWSPVLIDDTIDWVDGYRGLFGLDTHDRFAGERAPAGPKYTRSGTVRQSWNDPLGFAGLDKIGAALAAAGRDRRAHRRAGGRGMPRWRPRWTACTAELPGLDPRGARAVRVGLDARAPRGTRRGAGGRRDGAGRACEHGGPPSRDTIGGPASRAGGPRGRRPRRSAGATCSTRTARCRPRRPATTSSSSSGRPSASASCCCSSPASSSSAWCPGGARSSWASSATSSSSPRCDAA